MATDISQAPAEVREGRLPAEVRAAHHAQAEAALAAVRAGDRSQVVSFEALLAALEEPGSQAV